MNAHFETALQYSFIFLAWCKRHPKFLSTFFLFVLTFITLTVAFSTNIPDKISDYQNDFSTDDNKFIDFHLNATQLEWVTSNCGYYACIEDSCYCYIGYHMFWETANQNCRNSGLPNAGLIKPIEPKTGGVFETNKNLIGFLKSLPIYVGPLWSGLSRLKESEDFRSENGKVYSWFQSYKRNGERSREEKNCVHKLTSKGFVIDKCLHKDLLPLPADYYHLLQDMKYNQYFQWNRSDEDRHPPKIYIKAHILCESKLNSLSADEKECVHGRGNTTDKYYVWGESVYRTKTGFTIWDSNFRKRACWETSCYYDPNGRRAVINSKEEEKFILEEIDDIILEIGLQYSEKLDDLTWDNSSNGLPSHELKWYYEKQRVNGLKCLGSESLSDSDYQLSWVARRCSDGQNTICSFTPPQLGKIDHRALISVASDGMRNPYRGYFCLDKQRTSCYILLNEALSESKKFIREHNLRVAVVKDKDKKQKVAFHLRPHPGAYVGATSMLRGDKYEWMYEDKDNLVKFDPLQELPRIKKFLNNPSDKRDCLVLGSDDQFYPVSGSEDYVTLIDVSNDTKFNFLSVRKYAYF